VPLRIIIAQTAEIKRGWVEKGKDKDKERQNRRSRIRRVAPAWKGVHDWSKKKEGLNQILQELLRTV